MLRTLFLVICVVSASAVHAAQIAFKDVSSTLPVSHVYDGGWEFYVGGGAAVLDCDDNGFPDLFVAGGANPAILLRNTTIAPGESPQFANENIALKESLESSIEGITGAYPIDINGDGKLDLFVMRVGANRVLEGKGDCHFEDVTKAWSIDPGNGWTTAFSATWEKGQDWPTLAVGNYVDRENPDGPFGTCDTHQLFRPGKESYLPSETIAPGYCTLSMLFTDWSGNGQQDLWISNDRHYYVNKGEEQLFRITPKLFPYTRKDGWKAQKLWGMGIASRDITGDGKPEIAVTSMADQKLFTLAEQSKGPDFGAISYKRNMTAHVPYVGDDGRPSTGWHVQFGDINNDGLDDVFMAKGNVNQMPSSAMKDPDNMLIQQTDGRFIEEGARAGVASLERGRGAALADFNRDGLLDIVVVQRRAPLKIYQNISQKTGHWLEVGILNTGHNAGGNRFAVGAKIELEVDGKTQVREIQVGGGHAGGQLTSEHFGTGKARKARMRVRWPDGEVSNWAELDSDCHYTVQRGAIGSGVLLVEAHEVN